MSESAPTTPEPAAELRPGHRVQRSVTAGAVHAYDIDLAAGHYLRLTATPTAADLVLRLYAPDGELLVEQDDPWEEHGAEPVGVVAETAGRHRLEVRAATVAEGAEGGYELRAEPTRPATEEDRHRTAAEWALATGNVHRRARRYDDALARFHDAERGFRRLGDDGGETEALYGAGWMQTELHASGAADALRRAAERFGAAGQATRQVTALNRLAKVLHLDGDLAAARAAALEARRLAEPLSSRPDLQVTPLLRLGDLAHASGDSQEALDAFLAAVRTAKDGGVTDIFEFTSRLRLGTVYAELNELDDARDHLERAREIASSRGNRANEASALGELGHVHYRAGRLNDAQAALEAALGLHRQLRDEARQALDLGYLGTLLLQRGDLDGAGRHLEEALELCRRTKNSREEGMMLHKLGRQRYALGRLDEARDLHARAAALLTGVADRPALTSARFGVARVLHDQGRYYEAKQELDEILRTAEDLRRSTQAPDLRASWLDSKAHYWELYVDVLIHLHEEDPGGGHALLALAAAEKGRARSLLDRLEEARVDVRRGVDPELLEDEARIQRDLNEADVRRRAAEEPAAARELEQRVDELRRELRQVGTEIRRTSDLFSELDQLADTGAPGRADHIARLQREQLDADTLLLVYALGEERSFVWALSRRRPGVRVEVLAPRAEIERTVGHYLERLRSPAASDEPLRRRAGAEVTAQLLAPVADLLAARGPGFARLAVVADGALLHLPFAALPEPPEASGADDDPAPLVERFEIAHLPSATTLQALRRRALGRPPQPKTVAVVADPVYQADDPRLGGRAASPAEGHGHSRDARGAGLDDLPRLAETRREAAAILSLVPEDRRLAAVGFDAAADPELLARLAEYRVLHFATHALLDRARPELSGLVLSRWDEAGRPRDGLLRLHDVYDLRLPAELAVLSACETGLGRELRGEGLVGLARGFMYAGTPRLVVSLWRVDDAATAALMNHFYANLFEERMRPSAALRLAQRTMRRSDRWSAPYYWAGFVFLGDWHLGFSLARPDLPIEQSDNGGGEEPPPPRTQDDLPLPGDDDPRFAPPVREASS